MRLDGEDAYPTRAWVPSCAAAPARDTGEARPRQGTLSACDAIRLRGDCTIPAAGSASRPLPDHAPLPVAHSQACCALHKLTIASTLPWETKPARTAVKEPARHPMITHPWRKHTVTHDIQITNPPRTRGHGNLVRAHSEADTPPDDWDQQCVAPEAWRPQMAPGSAC